MKTWPEEVQVVAKLPVRSFEWSVPQFYNGTPTKGVRNGKAYAIVVVTNMGGRSRYMGTPQGLRSRLAAVMSLTTMDLVPVASAAAQARLGMSNVTRNAAALPIDDLTGVCCPRNKQVSIDTRVLPLRWDWRQFAYTDGSFIPVDNRPEGLLSTGITGGYRVGLLYPGIGWCG